MSSELFEAALGILSGGATDLAHIRVARGLLGGAGMRTFASSCLLVLVACSGHDGAAPDATAIPRCTNSPGALVTTAQIAPPSVGTVGVANPFLAVDATGVYYNVDYQAPDGQQNPPAGHLAFVPFGGLPVALADGMHPGRFVLAGSDVVYADDAGIHRVPRAGGTATPLVPQASQVSWLASDGQTLFYDDASGISHVALAGGSPQQLSSAIAFSGSLVDGDLVVADFSGDSVSRVSTATGATATLANGQSGPLYPIACGGGAICWIDAGMIAQPGALMKLAPGGMPTVVAQDAALFHPHGLAFDGAHFFVTSDAAGGTLARVDATNGQIDVLQHLHGDGDVTIDDGCVYYSDFDGVFALAKDAPPSL